MRSFSLACLSFFQLELNPSAAEVHCTFRPMHKKATKKKKKKIIVTLSCWYSFISLKALAENYQMSTHLPWFL